MKRQIAPQATPATDDQPTVDELLQRLRQLEDEALKKVKGGCFRHDGGEMSAGGGGGCRCRLA